MDIEGQVSTCAQNSQCERKTKTKDDSNMTDENERKTVGNKTKLITSWWKAELTIRMPCKVQKMDHFIPPSPQSEFKYRGSNLQSFFNSNM